MSAIVNRYLFSFVFEMFDFKANFLNFKVCELHVNRLAAKKLAKISSSLANEASHTRLSLQFRFSALQMHASDNPAN